MSVFDKLKQTLLQSALNRYTDLPDGLKPQWDVSKLYAHIEMKAEEKRIFKAIADRGKKGVSFTQLQSLQGNVERSFTDIPVAEKRLSDCEKRIAEFNDTVKDKTVKEAVDKLKKLNESLKKAEENLTKKLKIRDDFSVMLKACGINLTEGNTNE